MALPLARASSCRATVQKTVVHLPNTRYYATAVPGQSNAFKMSRQGAPSKNKKAFSRKNRLGAFRAMNPSQLTTPVLQSPSPPLSLSVFNSDIVTENMIGQVVEFPESANDPIKYFGTPKQMLLEFRLLSKRCSVIRNITVFTAQELDQASLRPSSETRYVMTGSAGCGKSFLLLQAVQYALAKEWVVIYLPRAKAAVNSTTTHIYDLRTQTYLQPTYANQTLRRILEVNQNVLQTMTMRDNLSFERREIPRGTSLAQLATIGVKEHGLASVVLETLMNELSHQNKIPVLLAVDDFQALYNEKTAYRDPHFAAIRPYHLAIPRMILEFASGKRSFQKGAVLGAVTSHDPAFPVPIELMDALDVQGFHATSPYDKRKKIFKDYTKGLMNLPVPEQFSLAEAASVFETWMKDSALTAAANDELFLSKYTESGGNPKAFVWNGLLSTLEGAPPAVDPTVPFPQIREGRIATIAK